MNVSLTPELEQLIHKKVETGRYLSASTKWSGRPFDSWRSVTSSKR